MNEEERQSFIKDGMKNVFEYVNTFSLSEKGAGEAVADEFMRFHRTIQQSIVRVLYHTIQAFNRTYEKRGDAAVMDARNEEAVKWIKAVAKIEAEYGFPHI